LIELPEQTGSGLELTPHENYLLQVPALALFGQVVAFFRRRDVVAVFFIVVVWGERP
jgi:hypothetical protein